MIASPSAIRPATWAVNTGEPAETAVELISGPASCRLVGGSPTGLALDVAAGSIAGNRLDALPALMDQ